MKLAKEVTKLVTEARDEIKDGYYLAVKKFDLSPGGGWSIGIKDKSILKYEKMRLMSWDVETNSWKNRKPPIQGIETFNPAVYGGGNMMVYAFNTNTKPISKKEADAMIAALEIDVDALLKEAGVTLVNGMLKKEDIVKLVKKIQKR